MSKSSVSITCCICGKKGYLDFSNNTNKEKKIEIVKQFHFCPLCEGSEDDLHYDKPK